jgi:D-glycero-alpha-D-manno-heptose-7-phosphate kinase
MKKIAVVCPYRISFSGGGTDVSPFPEMYGGSVINATIDRGIRVDYVDDGQPLEISSRDLLKSWSFSKRIHNSFLEGITDLFKERGIKNGRLSIAGDVPPGTGLGSSSALVLGLLQIVKILRGEELNRESLAKETYDIERNFFGVTLGRQDPFAISFGGMKYTEFNGENYKIETFDYEDPFVRRLEKSTLMVYTGSTHNSTDELQEEVSKLKEGSVDLIRRLLEIKRNTEEVRDSIKGNNFERFVQLIDLGWELKKGLGKRITNPKVDALINLAKKNGAGAARLMGGGSAGFVLVLSTPDKIWEVQKKMMENSEFVTRISFDQAGARSVTF